LDRRDVEMVTVYYGGRDGTALNLDYRDDLVVVRTMRREPVERTPLRPESRRLVEALFPVVQFAAAGVEVFRTPVDGAAAIRDEVRSVLKQEEEVRFVGRVLAEESAGEPVVYTENAFVKFVDRLGRDACYLALESAGLSVKRELSFARNAFFASAPDGSGLEVFDIAGRLLERDDVEFSHPELVREIRFRAAFPLQWHLKETTIGGVLIDQHSNVEAAWAKTQGEGTVIAVIDDGFDIEHEEFARSGKVVFPRNATARTGNPRPGTGNNHGTPCAGVACADGAHGAAGVAPKAKLMPIRLVSGLGSMQEAEAFQWAADNGADVISCSWGPVDARWWDPNDPRRQQVVPLPDSTRLAFEYALTNGRGGKGCVILFAAGNGNESVDNDGYASYPKVIAVAACNDRGKRSAYSDFGKAVWCAFPSNEVDGTGRTTGIWTTDWSGPSGYNPGNPTQGDEAGNYTNSFGGTSSACPGAAGVAALVLSRNADLRWDEVKDIFRRSADKIDPAGGDYDQTGRSDFYGYGRLNALKAVENAIPPQPARRVVHSVFEDRPIADLSTVRIEVHPGDPVPTKGVKVHVDIEHTYRGDLVVKLIPPAALGEPIILHDRTGGSADHLNETYDLVTTPAIGALKGKVPAGAWELEVTDTAHADTGLLRHFALEFEF
jgi:subtilisin family serine protease